MKITIDGIILAVNETLEDLETAMKTGNQAFTRIPRKTDVVIF
ncbi:MULTISPECIES: hypothetical protein [unclassified Bacillus (in: firmicutes)]|nr:MULTISPECIES: hypothetical protein [unclassified Bacillus (in: firmicutes)]SFB13206.1 hypothetical protein SAMN02799634_106175 [Bacillus sp. UNCCL13]SFQ90076.1 hypothetical protein SAMN04488577_3644 [Bacillus sp. cl95]